MIENKLNKVEKTSAGLDLLISGFKDVPPPQILKDDNLTERQEIVILTVKLLYTFIGEDIASNFNGLESPLEDIDA